MTNYNQRLDEVLANLVNQIAANEQRLLNGNATRKATIDSDSHATTQAKQAIASLYKELVAEAEPGTWVDPEDTDDLEWQGYVSGVEHFKQNLLKALEEV